MKKMILVLLSMVVLLFLTACAGQNGSVAENNSDVPSSDSVSTSDSDRTSDSEAAETVPDDGTTAGQNSEENSRVLIAYFTRLDNTDATLDEVIQGDGPYGPLGNSMEEADLDAIASASITLVDGEAQGNVETLAQMIQHSVGGDLFSIQTVQTYPVHYDTLIDQGGDEKSDGARPELATHVDSMADYDVVFLGFPNWWYDMPMPMYSFLEEYDFSGKTVIPFVSSASSGFSGTIRTMTDLLPDTTVVEHGLHIPMYDVAGAQADVEAWIGELESEGVLVP